MQFYRKLGKKLYARAYRFTPVAYGFRARHLNRRVVVVASSLRAAPETRGRARGRDRTFERTASRVGRISVAEAEGRGSYQVGTQDSFACAREPTRAVEHFVD